MANAAIVSAFGPQLARMRHAGDTKRAGRLLQFLLAGLFSASVLYGVTLVMGGSFAIHFVYGERFDSAVSLPLILCVANIPPISVLNSVLELELRVSGRIKWLAAAKSLWALAASTVGLLACALLGLPGVFIAGRSAACCCWRSTPCSLFRTGSALVPFRPGHGAACEQICPAVHSRRQFHRRLELHAIAPWPGSARRNHAAGRAADDRSRRDADGDERGRHGHAFVVWWIWCIGRAATQTPDYGLWPCATPVRPSTRCSCSFGVACVRREEDIERLARWLPWLIWGSVAYGALGWPMKATLVAWSPKLSSPNGESILCSACSTPSTPRWCGGAMHLLISSKGDKPPLWRLLLAGGMVCYAILAFQFRTTYLQLAAMGAMLMVFRRDAVWAAGVLRAGADRCRRAHRGSGHQIHRPAEPGVAVIFRRACRRDFRRLRQLQRRRGRRLVRRRSAAGSGGARLWRRVTVDQFTFLTGLGYGFPLVPFGNQAGIQVREPHSSIVSVLSRAGLIGVVVWCWMHIEILRASAQCYFAAGGLSKAREWRLLLLDMTMLLVLILTGTLGEDNLEKPFFAIPYYFFAGAVLGLARWRLRIEEARRARSRELQRAQAQEALATGWGKTG